MRRAVQRCRCLKLVGVDFAMVISSTLLVICTWASFAGGILPVLASDSTSTLPCGHADRSGRVRFARGRERLTIEVRVALDAMLHTARLKTKIDVNVGDPIWPAPQEVTVPRLDSWTSRHWCCAATRCTWS